MIYEMRTYTVKPGAASEYESRFGEAYAAREKYSKLGGMWHTEIGPLNQVIHVWPYESMQQRADTRAAAAKDPSGLWPPKTTELLVSQEVDILDPVAGMQDWGEPRQWGAIYELRMYTYAPGDAQRAATAAVAAWKLNSITTSQLGRMGRISSPASIWPTISISGVRAAQAISAWPMRPLLPLIMTLVLAMSKEWFSEMPYFNTPQAFSVAFSKSRFFALIGTSGSRYSSSQMPSIADAAFTGTGFVSMNRSLKIG